MTVTKVTQNSPHPPIGRTTTNIQWTRSGIHRRVDTEVISPLSEIAANCP